MMLLDPSCWRLRADGGSRLEAVPHRPRLSLSVSTWIIHEALERLSVRWQHCRFLITSSTRSHTGGEAHRHLLDSKVSTNCLSKAEYFSSQVLNPGEISVLEIWKTFKHMQDMGLSRIRMEKQCLSWTENLIFNLFSCMWPMPFLPHLEKWPRFLKESNNVFWLIRRSRLTHSSSTRWY